MELTLDNLTLKKEKAYFIIILIFALIFWVLIAISMIGIGIAVMIGILAWFANGLFVAYLKAEGVQVNEQQLPELYKTHQEVCAQLGLSGLPDLYVVQSGGLLNAFATRHARRDFVVLFSDMLEACGQNTDEIRFLIGHEVGHLKRRHIFKQMLLAPGLILPLIGTAYSRACETTCDRFGAFVTKHKEGAIKAMMILSGGREAGKVMNPQSFSQQYQVHRGFFVSWHELISGYPTLSQRVAHLLAIKEDRPIPGYGRHPLAYLFAIFSFGGASAGSIFITVAVIAMLAAIAIPNLLRAKVSANDALAQSILREMASGVTTYAGTNGGRYPQDMNLLVNGEVAFIETNYCGQTVGGFKFECALNPDGFLLKAVPENPGASGSDTFYISNEDPEVMGSQSTTDTEY